MKRQIQEITESKTSKTWWRISQGDKEEEDDKSGQCYLRSDGVIHANRTLKGIS